MPTNSGHRTTLPLPSSEADLQHALNDIEQQLGKLYRQRDPILQALAELRGPAVLPKPRNRTATQQAISRCPRCGGKLDL